MTLALLFHYLLLNMFRKLIHPSSGACDLFVELFHGLFSSGSMCVCVTLWFGWSGVASGHSLKALTQTCVLLAYYLYTSCINVCDFNAVHRVTLTILLFLYYFVILLTFL